MLAGTTMLLAAAAGAVAEGAAEAAHTAAKPGLPQLNPDYFTPQLFWLALTFALLFFILSKVALPRIGEVLQERKDRISRDIEAATKLKSETDAALADYEKALADARSNASSIAKQMRDKLAADAEAEKATVEKQIAAKLQDAEKRIGETKAKALSAVNEIAAETATAVVSKLIGQDVKADEVKKVLRPVGGA